jgi:hypothetical protein
MSSLAGRAYTVVIVKGVFLKAVLAEIVFANICLTAAVAIVTLPLRDCFFRQRLA